MTSYPQAEQNIEVAITEISEPNRVADTEAISDMFCPAPSSIQESKSTSERIGDIMLTTGANAYVDKNPNKLEELGEKVYKTAGEKVDSEKVTATASKSQAQADAYFVSCSEILGCVGIKKAQGMSVMLFATILALPFWLITKVVYAIKHIIMITGSSVNEVFSAVFGTHMTTSKDGEIINGKEGFNLLARCIFGFLLGVVCLAILFAVINAFTGFNIADWIKQYT